MLFSLFVRHVYPLYCVLHISVNISGVPLNATTLTLDDRIVGGTTTTIQNHPFQVKLLRYCSIG
jgi:hypothetical protein